MFKYSNSVLSVVLPIVRSSTLPCTSQRTLYDKSRVPRVMPDRKQKTMTEVLDFGYSFNYYQPGEALPRMPDAYKPLNKPKFKKRDSWGEELALFGRNDYIDIFTNGRVHPAQLLYHQPTYLRGFPGKHKATELHRLLHYRNLYKHRLERLQPKAWLELQKRINYLLKYHNYKKSDEMHPERDLGLWDEQPDFFYREKQRHSYDDPA